MKKIISIILSAIIAITCSLLFFSQIKFGSINIPRIIYATIAVNTNEKEYIIIKENDSNKKANDINSKEKIFASPKKVIIATPNDNYNFSDYVESNDYNILEQSGSQITIEKEGKKDIVYIKINQYYSLWQWY
ncbi:hypothetical protein [Eubacterium sp.]